ncbi:MAG: ATP-binding protein [Bacteroidota bacterium]
MKGFFKSLYWKLSAVFLILLLLVGAAYTYLSLFSSEMYFAETSQRINATLAQHIVDDIQPFVNGQPNFPAFQELFRDIMVVNPAVEVYLLDAEGRILTFDGPKDKVNITSIALAPVNEFIASSGKNLILGDNPRDIATPKVFSAAPVKMNGMIYGYIYVILRGEDYDSIAERIRESHVLTLGLLGLFLSFITSGCIGLVALALVTKKLRRLTRTALALRDGDYNRRVQITSDDELDQLGRAFNAMADTLSQHVEELKRTDTLRRELIANVSHDLRTPLASIQGYIETVLMKDDHLTVEERRKYLEIIFSSTERLNMLVQELFELSKLETKQTKPQSEPFSFPELVNDLTQKLAPLSTNKQVRLVTHFPENIPLVLGDVGLLDRVMQNLLDNAIRYTPSGGMISVDLRRNGDKIGVTVEDTGIGISQTDLPFVFDKFYQARTGAPTGGAGLGLTIVKKILEAHGESISVDSHENNGTRFSFQLPLAINGYENMLD